MSLENTLVEALAEALSLKTDAELSTFLSDKKKTDWVGILSCVPWSRAESFYAKLKSSPSLYEKALATRFSLWLGGDTVDLPMSDNDVLLKMLANQKCDICLKTPKKFGQIAELMAEKLKYYEELNFESVSEKDVPAIKESQKAWRQIVWDWYRGAIAKYKSTAIDSDSKSKQFIFCGIREIFIRLSKNFNLIKNIVSENDFPKDVFKEMKASAEAYELKRLYSPSEDKKEIRTTI